MSGAREIEERAEGSGAEPVDAALRRSQEMFRRVVEASPAGVHLYRLEGDRLVFRGANPAADRLLGVSNAQFVGKTIEEAFPPLAATEVPDRYRRAARDGIEWRTSQIDYDDGRIRGAFEVIAFQTAPGEMAAMFLDVADRLRAEQEVRESRERFRMLFERAPDACYIADFDGRLLDGNRASEELLGIERSKVAGRSVFELGILPATTPELVREVLARCRAGEPIGPLELVVRRPDGTEVPIEIRSVNMELAGQPVILGIARDISGRKRAEAENERLQAALAQAQKMEAVGRLAGGIAHDFNNLLTGIQAYAELVARALGPSHGAADDVREILKASANAAALTQQLLAFSRKQVAAPRVVDLAQVIASARRLLVRLIGEDIALTVEAEAGRALVRADPHQLEQVLVNLAANARDAMPSGGRLTLSATTVTMKAGASGSPPDLAPGRWALLAVTDTGVGMDDCVREHLFEPFFTTKQAGKGTGLGLASVYGMVRQNGGVVLVDSKRGEGTSFRIYLPAAEEAAEPAVEPRPAPAEARGEVVMLVEDDPMVRRLTSRIVAGLGYAVIVCASSDEALERSAAHPGHIDLLLTDVIMPGRNGRELFEVLRSRRPELKVVFMSGYTDDVIASRGVLEPGTRLVSKPFTTEELAVAVRAALDEK